MPAIQDSPEVSNNLVFDDPCISGECTPLFFDLLDFLLRVPSIVNVFTEEYPHLSAIPIILIGFEPVLFCTKTLWEGLIYHLGFHPLTFRPGSVAWRIRPRGHRAFAQVRTEAIIVAFDSDLRRPLLERLMGNPEGWPSKAQWERLMAPWIAAWTVGGLLLFVWGVFILGREWWRW